MAVKMIVTDLDGTFLRSDKSVSAYSQKVIRQCRQKGIIFVIATARPVRAVESLLPVLSCDAAIYHNGAVIKKGEKQMDGFGIPNPRNFISSLLDAYPGLPVCAEIQDQLYANYDPGKIWENIPYKYTDFTDLPEADADKIQIGRASCRERVSSPV